MQNKVSTIENSGVTVEDEIKALLGDEYSNTWLCALLGTIMGLLYPIMSSLY